MCASLFLHEEIARQRDLLREAAQERLARTARLDRAPAARVQWARLAPLAWTAWPGTAGARGSRIRSSLMASCLCVGVSGWRGICAAVAAAAPSPMSSRQSAAACAPASRRTWQMSHPALKTELLATTSRTP